MRQLSKKVKMLLFIFPGIVLIAIVGLLLIAINSKGTGRNIELTEGSVIYDRTNSLLTLSDIGTLQQNYDDTYSITDESKREYDLGSHSVIYEALTGSIKVLGGGVKINGDGSVKLIEKVYTIKDMKEEGFYKLSNSRYLLIGDSITDTKGIIATGKYLFVIIDASGNARMVNDSINVKTVDPLQLTMESVEFDMCEEKVLMAGNVIELDEIIGSYRENRIDKQQDDIELTIKGGDGGNGGLGGTGGDGGDGGDGGTGGTGGTGGQGGSGGDGGNGGSGGTGGTGGAGGTGGTGISGTLTSGGTRSMGIKNIACETGAFTIEYYVVDPFSTYSPINIIVEPTVDTGLPADTKTVTIDKNGTTIYISDLIPNTQYKVTMTYTDNAILMTGDTQVTSTNNVNAQISVEQMDATGVDVKVTLDSEYVISSGKVALYSADGLTNYATDVLTALAEVDLIPDEACDADGYIVHIPFDLTIAEAPIELMIAYKDLYYGGRTITTNVFTVVQNTLK